ncbi:hypothetical protein FQN49_005457 [Arthroderma sp. PD_2]|nr:hypothetical protein FQN49_005457 [Arthroderma sp. PD_2]
MAHPSLSAHFSGDENKGLQFAHNSGTLNYHNHQHYQGARPETPPEPSCEIPFKRDADFVDRETIFDRINEVFEASGSRAALVGIGGVGKSQIAIEYAYRLRDQLLDTWIFWVYASNSTRFEESLQDIAYRVNIPGRDDPRADILKLVYNWLQCNKRKWVIILDNADNLDFLEDTATGMNSKRLSKYIPETPHGSVFITSRSKETALQLVEEKCIISVDPMDEAHAVNLFRKKLNDGSDDNLIAELAVELEFLPLAIAQAASYISLRVPRCSVEEYLEDFRESKPVGKLRLLGDENRDHRRDEDAVNSISATWKISFNDIRKARPSAADLLAFISFFDRQGIPDFVLQSPVIEEDERAQRNENDGPFRSKPGLAARDKSLESDILALRNYCFISIGTNPQVFDTHRLVQLVTQEWLHDNGSFEGWQGKFIDRLWQEFSINQFENWGRCQQLFPHVKSAIGHQPREEEQLRHWAQLVCLAVGHANNKGNAADAVTMSTTAVNVCKEPFGEQVLDTALCQAVALSIQSTLSLVTEGSARPWRKTLWARLSGKPPRGKERVSAYVVRGKRREAGADDPSTLASMTDLAITYSNSGNFKKAVKLHIMVLESRKETLGLEHPDTLKHTSYLALTYCGQGRLDKAKQLFIQVIELSKKINGNEHPDTLRYISDLAWIYSYQDRLGYA